MRGTRPRAIRCLTQIPRHFARRLRPRVALLLERAKRDRLNGGRDFRIQYARPRRRIIDMFNDYGCRGRRVERYDAGQHFKQDDAQTVDVRAPIQLFTQTMLRRHVMWRPHDGAGSRQPDGFNVALRSDVEIEHLDLQAAWDCLHENILGFDVAMNYTLPVHLIQRRADLSDNLGGYSLSRPAMSLDQTAQAHSFGQLHYLIVQAFSGNTEVVNRNDVRMLKTGGSLRLAAEAFDGMRIGHSIRVEYFDRHPVADPQTAGAINSPHTTNAEFGLEVVLLIQRPPGQSA